MSNVEFAVGLLGAIVAVALLAVLTYEVFAFAYDCYMSGRKNKELARLFKLRADRMEGKRDE